MQAADAFKVMHALRLYERAAFKAGQQGNLQKAAAYQAITGQIQHRAVTEGLDLSALRKAYDPQRRDALLAAMGRAGASTFEAKVGWVRAHLDDVSDPQSFVGWLLHGQETAEHLRKAYKLHSRRTWKGLDISIEQGKGETRNWKNKDAGTEGSTFMAHAYGYIKSTTAPDGDALDVYVGPHPDQAKTVYLVRQRRAPLFIDYDETKVMIGFESLAIAQAAYLQQYDDVRFLGATIYSMDADTFAAYVAEHGHEPPPALLVAHPVDIAARDAQQNPLKRLQHGDMLRKAFSFEPELETPSSLGDALRKAVQVARAGRSHKYLRRVPTGNPKNPWRYYYTYASLGRGAHQGEQVRLGDKLLTVAEVGPDGVTVHEDGKDAKKLSVDDWHNLMHEHHGDAYVSAVDKRARGWASAVYKHLPRELLATAPSLADVKERAPEVYEALARSFKRAGVQERDAQGMVAWLLGQQGWTPDARACLLGAGCDLKHGVGVVRDYRAIGADAAKASGNKEVGAGHVSDVLAARGVAAAALADKKDVGKMAERLQAKEAAKAAVPTAAAAPVAEPAPEAKPEPAKEPEPPVVVVASEPEPEPEDKQDLASQAPRDPHTGAFDLGQHIPMAKRERWWIAHGAALRAAILGENAISLEEAEAEGVAKKLITKKMLLGDKPSATDLRDQGYTSGGAYIMDEIHDALGAAPPDSPAARQAYTDIVRSIWLVTQNAKTPEQLQQSLSDYWSTWEAQPHQDWTDPAKVKQASEHDLWLSRFYSQMPDSERTKNTKNAVSEMDAIVGRKLTSLLMSAASKYDDKRKAALTTAHNVFVDARRKYDGHKSIVKEGHIGTREEMRARAVYGSTTYGYDAAGKHFKKDTDAWAAVKALNAAEPRYAAEHHRAPLPGESFTFRDDGRAVGEDGKMLSRVPMPPESRDWSWAKEAAPKPPKTAVQKALEGRGVTMLERTDAPPGREGPDAPEGSDAQIMERFGVRGVQHGNYLTEADRTHHARQAYVALHDMVSILGLPDSAVSYNGRLGLAFGARGGGRALAHYERSLKVINITRDRGGGTIAHEWGHFFDHMLGSNRDQPQLTSVFASDMRAAGFAEDHDKRLQSSMAHLLDTLRNKQPTPEQAAEQAKLERQASWGRGTRKKEARKALASLGRTEFADHAGRLGPYWCRPHEMFARAFEGYVADKLQEKGQENGYLVNHPQQSMPYGIDEKTREHLYAYPRGEERVRIKEAFDRFFDAARGHGILAKAFGLQAPTTVSEALAQAMQQN